MARFSPILPTWLGTQLGTEVMGDYHLLLAHDVIDHPEESRKLYDDPHNTIIMDNSLIELGYPIEGPKMVEAVSIIRPTCVVLPDYLGEAEQTIAASWQFSAQMDALLPGLSKMGVIQGRTLPEALGCATKLMMIPGVDCLSIPRVLTEYLGTRVTITEMVLNMFPNLRLLHLLGFSDDLVDDVNTARIPGVSGIDSAVPVRLGLQLQHLSMDYYVDPGPRGDYWTARVDFSEAEAQRDMITNNIGRMRYWLDEGKPE